MTMQFAFATVPSGEDILRRGAEVIRAEAIALNVLAERLNQDFVDACELIMGASGRVVITGMGKSGHIGRKWAATMAATGTPAIYVHPGEASHGDLGMLVPGDILVVISNSGNTGELRCFLKYAASINVPVIGVGSQKNSLVMQNARVKLCYPAMREACPVNVAPTTSTTLQLALGDALALTLMDMRGFSVESMKRLHPGGTLGLRLTSVRDIMHRGCLPLVQEDAPMQDVVVMMTSAGFGIAGVVDVAGRLAGVITDGDLRRHFDHVLTATAGSVMNQEPKTVPADMLAEEVLRSLNENQITAAFVMEPGAPVNHNVPIGIVHVHDLLRLGLN